MLGKRNTSQIIDSIYGNQIPNSNPPTKFLLLKQQVSPTPKDGRGSKAPKQKISRDSFMP